MVYEYKLPGLFKASAQVAGEVCAKLECSADGLSAKSLVNASRDASAPLHGEFEWDDAVAGELYREDQARMLIRNIVVVSHCREIAEPVRAFVRVSTTERKQQYHNIQTVIEDDFLKRQLLNAAQRDMDAFVRKYKTLAELADVIQAIEKHVC